MKKFMKKAVLFILLASVPLSGCAKGTASSNAQVVNVGTMGTYKPFSYVDEDEKLTGYDIEVLRLLDEKIPDVSFEFVTTPFDDIFLGLDSKKLGIGANQISKTPSREEKYLFSDKGYFYARTKLVVHEDNNDATSLADFAGKKMGGLTGDYFTEMLEEYNNENGNPFEIVYYNSDDYTQIMMDISSGRIDGTLNDTIMVDDIVKSLGLKIKMAGDVIESSPSYFVIRKDDPDLKAKLDKALDEALQDGSLKSLSEQWFGDDYTK